MRYSGVRALSGTISIGTLHNGARGDEDIDDPDRSEAGDNRVEGRENGDDHDAVSEHDIGDCRFGWALYRDGVSFAQMYPHMCLEQR